MIRCPNCNHRFEIDPDSPELFELGQYEKKNSFPLPSLSFPRLTTKKIIPFLMFFILGIYILRTCSHETNSLSKPIDTEQNYQKFPESSPEADQDTFEKNQPSPLPSQGTSI
ncbi:MAG: hypothetical protein MH321_05960 [Leptospiraceae bacterium]|nr:hypothetical protein [Leptospiraceae bacterium]